MATACQRQTMHLDTRRFGGRNTCTRSNTWDAKPQRRAGKGFPHG